ncbi:hypothetical protein Bca52824_071963 [Brassica carinata]|uniref:GST C-terminal domain-containing protein n=1 Tax=Brassica carinata TaxID=52824 RepID=A0A8X7U4I0_BRACI|nr:hypothetical protein Bca52824_071963 [Brassica carinata]
MAASSANENSDKPRRTVTSFRNFVSQNHDSQFPAESGRYHLCLAVLKLKGLDKAITFTSVQPLWRKTKENDEHMGWVFPDSDKEVPGAERDHINGAKSVRGLYDIASLNYTGKCTVPVLWDKKLNTIVNNESSEILRMFSTEFNHFAEIPCLDLYPPNLRSLINETNEWVHHGINNGVYKCGFATTQTAYDEAVKQLFDALDKCEEILEKQRFLCGNTLTEPDIRLFVTLIRFDEVAYTVIFKCSKRLIREYSNLFNYTKDIYQIPGLSSTVKMDHVKQNYYGSFPSINPLGIVAHGPNIDYSLSHDRHRFS